MRLTALFVSHTLYHHHDLPHHPFGCTLCNTTHNTTTTTTITMKPFALVSPSSRGIGFELVRRLLQTTPHDVPIIATARKDIDETKEKVLSGLKDVQEDRLHVLKLDVLGE